MWNGATGCRSSSTFNTLCSRSTHTGDDDDDSAWPCADADADVEPRVELDDSMAAWVVAAVLTLALARVTTRNDDRSSPGVAEADDDDDDDDVGVDLALPGAVEAVDADSGNCRTGTWWMLMVKTVWAAGLLPLLSRRTL